jgi:topoisomerase-4 subunit A
VAELCEHIKGPDFPTNAEIITRARKFSRCTKPGAAAAMRAVWERDRRRHRDHRAAVPGVRSQGAGADRQQMQAKKLPMVVGPARRVRPREPTRLVIVPRSNRVDVEALMGHLFATTDLERSYRVNLNMIGLDGRPRVKGLTAC